MATPPLPAVSNPSVSNPDNSATHTPPSPPKDDDSSNKNNAHLPFDEMPDSAHFKILDSEEYKDKCRKYEADYTLRLMSKYFSKQNFYGGNIFDDRTTIQNETILSSRWPCTRSFADPVNSFVEQRNVGSPQKHE